VALDTILVPLCPPSENTKQEHGYLSPAMPAAGRVKGAGRGGRCGLVQEVTGGMHPGDVLVDGSHMNSHREVRRVLPYTELENRSGQSMRRIMLLTVEGSGSFGWLRGLSD